MEEWREVPCNSNYEVSNTGRVRRIGSKSDRIPNDSKGYLAVGLYANGKGSTKRIHRLVAEAFIPNPDNKPEINHKDGNRYNNSSSNLEWVTKRENCRHAWDNNLIGPSYGMRGKTNPNGGRKGKPFKIVETGEVFNTLEECEQAIDGNNRHINDCLRGRQRTHRGYHFEYVNN